MSYYKLRSLNIDTKNNKVNFHVADSSIRDYDGNLIYEKGVQFSSYNNCLEQFGKKETIAKILVDIYDGNLQGGSTVYEMSVKYFVIKLHEKFGSDQFFPYYRYKYVDENNKSITREEFSKLLYDKYLEFRSRKKEKVVAMYAGAYLMELRKNGSRTSRYLSAAKTWKSKEDLEIRLDSIYSKMTISKISIITLSSVQKL